MKYSDHLRKSFPDLLLQAEDILFLEPFQIGYLPNRVPKNEFAAFLRKHPIIQQHLVSKHPAIAGFFKALLKEGSKNLDEATIAVYCQESLWEIAELIVYSKYPEVYDAQVHLEWKLDEVVSDALLKGKVVIDAGAGTGRLSFMTLPFAKTVFALEPVSAFRRFIREKRSRENISNLYPIDGFLDDIPLPDNTADVLITSNAFGWKPEAELKEIERVLKTNGQAIHLFRAIDSKTQNLFHEDLINAKYTFTDYKEAEGLKLKYIKYMKNN